MSLGCVLVGLRLASGCILARVVVGDGLYSGFGYVRRWVAFSVWVMVGIGLCFGLGCGGRCVVFGLGYG